MARLRGVEPLTLGSEVRCSVQLSYRRGRKNSVFLKNRLTCMPFYDKLVKKNERAKRDFRLF